MEKILESTISQESIKLLEALNLNKIRFAHWKSNCRLLESLEGKTDLDILIYPEDKAAFNSVMEKLRYKKLKSPPWNAYPNVEDWIAFDYETGIFLHLHIHFALVTGIRHVKHLYLPWMEVFFSNIIIDEPTEWPIPKPELEAIIMFIRIWAKIPPEQRSKPTVPDLIQIELINLLKHSNDDALINICYKLKLEVPGNIKSSIYRIVNENNTLEIINLSKYFYQQVIPYYRQSMVYSLTKTYYYKYYLKSFKLTNTIFGPLSLKKRLVNGGKIIALIGSDGSGKTSLSKDLIKWLTYKIDSHYYYFGKDPYINSYNNKILSLTNILFKDTALSKVMRRLIGSFSYVVLIRKKHRLLQLARKAKYRGSVIICDRFPQKNVLGMNDGMNLQVKKTWCSELEKKEFYRTTALEPDLVFVLKVSPETASRRKPQHDLEVIKKKCAILNQITFKNAKVIQIDADRPYNQVLLSLKREIWNNL